MTDVLHLKFENMSRSVRLIDCSELIEHFPVIFPGWQISEVHENTENPILTLHAESTGYVLTAEWKSEPKKYKDKVDALCGFVAKLVRAYIDDDRNLLCLHGAAADFGGNLVVFPSVYRAGKSVLSAALASDNVKIYGDDVLPINLQKGYGIAPGLAPRLRTPLPDCLDTKTRHFIKQRTILKGKQYIYLDLRDDWLAKKGSQAEVAAFVLLERKDGFDAVLEPVAKADILRQVVWQNFAREVESPRILAKLQSMVEGAGRFRLRYDRPEDAVDLLKNIFENYSPTKQLRPAVAIVSNRNTELSATEIPQGCYLRAAEISEVIVDDENFLADAKGAAIHHLNPIGTAIWTLLAEPISTADIVKLLLTAFPEAKPKQIERDVAALLKVLKTKKLVIAGVNRESIKHQQNHPLH